jgi:hypothetical protein
MPAVRFDGGNSSKEERGRVVDLVLAILLDGDHDAES